MKNFRKTFLATAIASLGLCAGSASALEMNLYGTGHLSLDSSDDGQSSQLYLASNSSRLGFRGDHALSDGVKVIFQYESGVDLTGRGVNDGNGGGNDNANSLFTTARDAWLGVSGRFGTVQSGRLPGLNQWVYDYNLFADQVGDLGNIWGATGIPARANGVVAYTTPANDLGLSAALSYQPESGNEKQDGMSLVVKYDYQDVLELGAAYASIGEGLTGAGASKPDHTVAALTVGFEKGGFTVGGGYQTESDIGGSAGEDRDSYTLGASFTMGEMGVIKAQYTSSSSDSGTYDGSMYAIGYDYHYDKHTTVYVAYASTSNDPGASFTANNYGHGQTVVPGIGDDPASLSFGLVYSFDTSLTH